MIDELTLTEFDNYLSAIGILQARETLLAFDVSVYPYLKKETRTRLRDKHKRDAQFYIERKSGNILDEIEKKLKYGR